MRSDFFDKLCCPFDKADLNLKVFEEEGEEIREGLMTCTECGRYFPVIYGIPIMSPDEYRQHELEAPILKRWGLQLQVHDDGGFRLKAIQPGGMSSSGS